MNAPRKTGDLPGQKGDIAASIKQYVEQGLVDLDVMLPAMVEKYDRVKNVVTVRPLVAIMNANRFTEKRHSLASIPAYASGAGDFVINFPIKKGNIGWIFAADRDITEYKEKLRDVAPRTSRSHSFSDGWFVPDIVRGFTISAEDEDAMVIQTLDGSTKIAIHPDWIKIKAPSKVVSDSPLTEATGDLKVAGDAEIGGDLTVGGDIEAGGGLKVTGQSTLGDTTVNGKPVTGDGGGTPVDAYTKTESDARYYPKTDGQNLAVVVAGKFGPDNKPKPSDIDKAYYYAGQNTAVTILANQKLEIVPTVVQDKSLISRGPNYFIISRAGLYKISFGVTLDPRPTAQNLALTLAFNNVETPFLSLLYVPSAATMTSGGSFTKRLAEGDQVKLYGLATNNTSATVYAAGFLAIEQIG